MDTKDWKDLKNILSSLLISCPLQLTIRSLNNDFRNEVGYNIPYEKFGFRTLEQCLDNMTDILQRNGSFISVRVSSKTAHIDKLISRQTIPTRKPSRYGGPPKRQQRRHTLFNYENLSSMPESYNERPHERRIPPLIPSSGFLLPPPMQYPLTPQPLRKNISFSTYPKTPQPPRKVYTSTPNAVYNISKSNFNHGNLKSAKSESQLTHTLNLRKSEGHLTKHEDISQKNNTDRLVANISVPLEMQKNLIDLITKFDNGVWCGELPEIYQRLYKKELDYTRYGFKNLILMCMELEKIFYCHRPNKADFILYDRIKPLPSKFETHVVQSTDNELKPAQIETIVSRLPKPLYPLNVLHLFDVVPSQFTLCDFKKDDFIKVYLQDVYNPDLFFITLPKYSDELDKLMDQMQVFYSKRRDEFKIPKSMINENLYCVTVYNKEYHRAKIVQVLQPTDSVKVFCFDYGSIDFVKSSDLYYLHKRFIGLPQQAIEAQLGDIKSSDLGGKWSEEASLQLFDLARDKDLYSRICNVDRVRQRLDVFLVETSEGTNVHINNLLVNKGYALFKDQTNTMKAISKSDDVIKNVEKPRTRMALLKMLQQLYTKKSET